MGTTSVRQSSGILHNCLVEGAHLPFQVVLFSQRENDRIKFKHQLDCPDITEVSYTRDLLTMKHQQLASYIANVSHSGQP